jgi:hypothetical protein
LKPRNSNSVSNPVALIKVVLSRSIPARISYPPVSEMSLSVDKV